MGTSTNGEIFFGVVFDEEFQFPWNNEDGEGDIDDWWLEQTGYKPSVELFDAEGEYIGGIKPSQKEIDAYFDERSAWRETHPLPVELVNYQSANCPAYALAIPKTVLTARRGYPERFSPSALRVAQHKVEPLLAFCEKYGLEFEGEPGWYLSSYWG